MDNAYAGGNTSTEPKTTTPPDISCGDELYCPSTSTCGSVACVNPDGDIVGIIGCCVASGEDVLDKCPCLPGTTPAVE